MQKRFFINQELMKGILSIEAALLYSVLNEMRYLAKTVKINGVKYEVLSTKAVMEAVPIVFRHKVIAELLEELKRLDLVDIPEGCPVTDEEFTFAFGKDYFKYFIEGN